MCIRDSVCSGRCCLFAGRCVFIFLFESCQTGEGAYAVEQFLSLIHILRVLFMSPQGKTFSQEMAKELAQEEELIFLCGHYEGKMCIRDSNEAGCNFVFSFSWCTPFRTYNDILLSSYYKGKRK